MSSNSTASVVENEGCELHYWYQGQGPLLIMVPGGNGHGRQYNHIMPLLSQHFTVATFDRRQMSSSNKVDVERPLSLPQQARDIIAIITALGCKKSNIFASSGGGVIGFQFAISYPQYIEKMVIHEAPTTSLLPEPEATELLDWFYVLLQLYKDQGKEMAFKEFTKKFVGMEHGGPRQTPEDWNGENFWRNEALIFSIYCPYLHKIVENNVSVAVGYGEHGGNAFYARTTVPQAEILKCPRVEFPGHHQGFESVPEEFYKVLMETFEVLEKR